MATHVTLIGRCFRRDIVVVQYGGYRQAFYRSTGDNSGMTGTWLPFDGIKWLGGSPWFDKSRFTDGISQRDPLFRFGTPSHHYVSGMLGRMNIPRLGIVLPGEVNVCLRYTANEVWAKVFGSMQTLNEMMQQSHLAYLARKGE